MRVALILIWLTVVVCLSLSPWEVKAHLHSMGKYHNFYHWTAFTITTLVLAWDSRRLSSRIALSAVAFCFALVTEMLEHFFFHNPYEWHDVLIDCIGIATAFVILSGASAVLRPRSPQYSRR